MKRALVLLACLVARVARADDRDPDAALALTIAGSVAGVGFAVPAGDTTPPQWRTGLALLVGAELAPTIGHVYAGDYLSLGLAMRVAGGGLIALGCADPFPEASTSIGFSPLGGAAVLTGLGLSIGGIVYDLATARNAARAHNARHVDVLPTVFTGPGTGVGLVGVF